VTTSATNTIFRNTLYIVTARGAELVIRLVWVVIAARILGPDLYALLAYSLAWQLTFMPLAIFGVGAAFAYLIAPDRSRAPEYAAHVLAIRLVTIVIAVVACVALSHVFMPDPRAPALIAVLSLLLAAMSLNTFAQTVCTAFEVNQYMMRQGLAFNFLDLFVSVGILLGGGDLLLLVTAKTIIAWLQTAWALSVVHRRVMPMHIVWEPDKWKPLLRVALPAMMITLAADWRFNGSLILFRNLNPDGVLFSQYALAMQALMIISIFPTALGRAAFPAIRRAVARGDGKELLFARTMQRSAPIIGTIAGLLGLTLGEPVFRWILGDPYSTAGELVGLTLWGLIPLTAQMGYPEVLIAHGRFRAMVIISVASAAVMTLLTFTLVPVYGVTGAIIAVLTGFSVSPAAAFVLAWRDQLADPVSEVIRPFAAAALGIGAYFAMATISDWAALVAGLLALVAATLALGVVGPSELRALRAGLSRS
jgi:O-antigen/teichoic acid export membrane protein